MAGAPPEDTIAAVATAAGRGGIGILRLSGAAAITIARQLTGRDGFEPRHAHRTGFFAAGGERLDDGLVLYFPGPHSFTGEDVVEFNCHGSPVVLDLLLEAACTLGARPAQPGEFSRRAFLNDKLDLAQAEAIADLIDSASAEAARSALRSLSGAFSERVNELVTAVTRLRVYVEAAIDFPDEEDVDFLAEGDVARQLSHIAERLGAVRESARQGSLLREGLKLVIAGRPNAGKSSLLNALAGEERAIVTAIAGTTRDVLREAVLVHGLPLHIVDTAGLRESDDPVEQEGVRRAMAEIASADRVLLVVDDNAGDAVPALTSLLPAGAAPPPPGTPVICVHNKIDLSGAAPAFRPAAGGADVWLSATTGEGLDLLRDHLRDSVGLQAAGEGTFSARRRHLDALDRAGEHLAAAREQLAVSAAGELVAEDLRYVQASLGEITGRVSSDDLLGEIFSSFCIGK
ncbi:tRNA uridine-5-carboxymethylaminomethyl(34) synthesis GTPase MnmE [Pseudohaliea rubra]|uniref:tRNA modification GTPase MnmE n=1 Tax=Pseudohaliea rubra DSM 19751 TaxID=1265313 RepID=A0A095XXI1_9GAMM|nr:tRNA uridine-5-carboxymethylaminomethyl(34) synthesis GTPase MnmE [Pseudohaliea rubra]KGE04436.1 GTPase and tRNA-U34 5-formylation enzyme TrmE [Pseudohaliea rubra DSM 19751]